MTRKRAQHRVAAGLRLTYGPAQHQPEFLGAFLPRETALQNPRIDRLWHTADHIVPVDPRIAAIEAWRKLGSQSALSLGARLWRCWKQRR